MGVSDYLEFGFWCVIHSATAPVYLMEQNTLTNNVKINYLLDSILAPHLIILNLHLDDFREIMGGFGVQHPGACESQKFNCFFFSH